MHILIGIVTAVVAIVFFIMRMQSAARAGAQLADTVTDVSRAMRRHRWEHRRDRNVLESVEDPRRAAAGMLCAVAEEEGAITEVQTGLIRQLMTERLEVPADDCEDFFTEARWLAGQAASLDVCLERLSVAIRANCTPDERADLLRMLRDVAGATSPASDTQKHAIGRLELKLDRKD